MESYDFIIAGGGAAGLSLAIHLLNSPLADRPILLIDLDEKKQNDRTWCFWTEQPTLFDSILCRSWNQISFISDSFQKTYQLSPYRYQMIRGIDFYNYARQELAKHPNVEWIQGYVERVEDSGKVATVTVGNKKYNGQWVFDSLFRQAEFFPNPHRYHYIKQHFKGWEIETPSDVFNVQSPILFDFRVPQLGEMRFIYILPLSEHRAWVEFTLFSSNLLTNIEYEKGLRDYIVKVLGVSKYHIHSEENGNIPLSDQPFNRRSGQHILNIGTKGGRVKPTTGYAFLRIQRDSINIIQSLLKHGHPFKIPADPFSYRFTDSVMLQLMYRRGGEMKTIFSELFLNNPIQRLLKFLDESATPLEVLQVMTSLPPWPFLQALVKLKVMRRL